MIYFRSWLTDVAINIGAKTTELASSRPAICVDSGESYQATLDESSSNSSMKNAAMCFVL